MIPPLAIVPVFNEADVLPSVLAHLRAQGCQIHVLDNWSTDSSASIALQAGATVELWPPDSRPERYEWTGILKRVEELALGYPGRWIILHDADEIRRAPAEFLSATLAESLDRVQREGYNAIDHNVMTFAPIDDSYNGGELEKHFRHYIPEYVDQKLPHVKAWLQGSSRVDLHTHGGHRAVFPGVRVHPASFVLKHYPVRSQAHGERKVLIERLPRYSPAERDLKWHVQYDGLANHPHFVRRKQDLILARRPVAIVTLTAFGDIFENCIAHSAERFEPRRHMLVVTNSGIDRPAWQKITGVEPFVFAANLNIGIRAAGTDCDVLCVNDDVTLTAPLIESLQRVFDMDDRIGIVSPQVDGGIGLRMAEAGCSITGPYALSEERIPFVCVLLRREMIDQIGLLDERFDGYGGDDDEYCQRAMESGFNLAVTSQVTVKHGYGDRQYSSSFLRVMTPDERERSMARMIQKAQQAQRERSGVLT